MESILSYLWQAVSATLMQVLILLVPGMLLTLVLYFETRFVQRRAVEAVGRGWYLGLFGWLGTAVHELGHALFCLIFGHKITEIELFHPDSETGTLGYVKHSYNRKNIYHLAGNFFIGIGPILLGTAAIFLLSWGLLGLSLSNLGNNFSLSTLNSWEAFRNLWQNIWSSSGHLFTQIFSWQHLATWQWWVFVYLAFAIGSSLTLSPPDVKSALGGFIVIVVLMLVLNLATVWAGNFISDGVIRLAGYYTWFYAIIFLILLINLAAALIIFLPTSRMKSSRSKAA
jgi:hypothetical protein